MGKKSKVIGAGISARSHTKEVVNLIRDRLKGDSMKKFESSCFGHLLDLGYGQVQFQLQLIFIAMLHLSEEKRSRRVPVFKFNKSTVEFTKQDFYIMTGLKFGEVYTPPVSTPSSATSTTIHASVFRSKEILKFCDIKKAFIDACDLLDGDGDKCVKLGLLVFLYGVVLPRDKFAKKLDTSYLPLADSISMFNDYPWGTVAYEYLSKELFAGYDRMLPKLKARPAEQPKFDLCGFLFPFQCWLYEIMPSVGEKMGERVSGWIGKYPRVLRWRSNKRWSYDSVKALVEHPSVVVAPMVLDPVNEIILPSIFPYLLYEPIDPTLSSPDPSPLIKKKIVKRKIRYEPAESSMEEKRVKKYHLRGSVKQEKEESAPSVGTPLDCGACNCNKEMAKEISNVIANRMHVLESANAELRSSLDLILGFVKQQYSKADGEASKVEESTKRMHKEACAILEDLPSQNDDGEPLHDEATKAEVAETLHEEGNEESAKAEPTAKKEANEEYADSEPCAKKEANQENADSEPCAKKEANEDFTDSEPCAKKEANEESAKAEPTPKKEANEESAKDEKCSKNDATVTEEMNADQGEIGKKDEFENFHTGEQKIVHVDCLEVEIVKDEKLGECEAGIVNEFNLFQVHVGIQDEFGNLANGEKEHDDVVLVETLTQKSTDFKGENMLDYEAVLVETCSDHVSTEGSAEFTPPCSNDMGWNSLLFEDASFQKVASNYHSIPVPHTPQPQRPMTRSKTKLTPEEKPLMSEGSDVSIRSKFKQGDGAKKKRGPSGFRVVGAGPVMYDPMKPRSKKLHLDFSKWYKAALMNNSTIHLRIKEPEWPDAKFFKKIYDKGAWLSTEHTDALLQLLILKSQQKPEQFLDRWTILEYQCWVFLSNANAMSRPQALRNFVNGVLPAQGGKPWKDVDHLYGVAHVNGDHFVAYDVQLRRHQIIVYDSMSRIPGQCAVLRNFEVMCAEIPKLLIRHGLASKDMPMKWPAIIFKHPPQQSNGWDCGIYAVKFIECLASGRSVHILQGDIGPLFRENYCSELFNSRHLD